MPRSSLYRLLAVALIAHLVIPSARADDASDFAQMQIREQAGPLFDSAAQEFSVPADLLRAYAFVHTRWSLPAVTDDPAHTPAIYGIMGLHDGREGWFISQVGRAAKLLGVSEEQIRHDLRTNVRAAAALLSDAARQRGIEGEVVESWVPAVEAISAIPMASPVDRFARKTEAYDVLDVLHRGHDGNGIRIAARFLDLRRAFSTSDLSLMRAPSVNAAEIAAAGGDYPQALWNPTTCFESRAGAATTHIAIHTMQGYYASTISWFKNCRNEVSAHYLVRSSDGQITQMVHEADMAWHVRPIANPYTVGIEHEGFITDPIWYTKEIYEASAMLVRDVCVRRAIDCTKTYGGSFQGPLSDIEFKVKGHVHFAGQTHTDPGVNWDWPRYRALVLGAPERDASILKDESAVPAKLAPGSAQTVRVRVRNTGSSPWKASEGYRLGTTATNGVVWSAFSCGGYMNTPKDGRVFLCADVPPGGVVDFVFNVTAPASGPASLSVRMVRDGVAWFGESASWPIAVEVPLALRYRDWIQSAADWQPWTSGWSGNPASLDALAGTVGQGLRLEAFQAVVEGSGAGVCYQAHVQNVGWQEPICDGGTTGIVRSGLRIEAVKAWLRSAPAGARLCYRAHVQNIGWMGEVCDGAQAGSTGQSLRLEALQMRIVR